MLISLIRTLILYFFIVSSIRLMGKRQVGEMQPTELVITILISAVASVPMQDTELPLVHGIVPIITLVAAEMIMSLLFIKFPKLRRLISGRAITVIREGEIDQIALKRLRLSIEDVLEDLRLKDVYDLRKVRLAQVETNGQLSILLDNTQTPPTARDLGTKVNPELPFETLISDGSVMPNALARISKSEKWLDSVLRAQGAKCPKDVFLLCADEQGNVIFSRKG